MSFRPVPPVDQAPQWGPLVSDHELLLHVVHTPLEREDVLNAVLFKGGACPSRGFRLSKYSMASSSVGVANGPRRMAASISGQESLCVTVTIACISPNSESSDMAKRSRCCFFHLMYAISCIMRAQLLSTREPVCRLRDGAAHCAPKSPRDWIVLLSSARPRTPSWRSYCHSQKH